MSDAKQLQELKVENDMVLALVLRTGDDEYEAVNIETAGSGDAAPDVKSEM
jgi:hypothetical protein